MCDSCGCGSTEIVIKKVDSPEENPHHDHHNPHDHDHSNQNHHNHNHHHHDHHHDHSHVHAHPHAHAHQPVTTINVETDILQQNNLLAARNRGYFDAKNILTINLVSSPGSGKTTLLEQTLDDLKNQVSIMVIEGDQQTAQDGRRIAQKGIPVVQINTGKGCHLDSEMVYKAVKKLQPEDHSLLFIENVGNLVCPALFDLGEQARVVIVSVTEGADKPLKYPDMFLSSQLCIINKIDLLPYVPFELEEFKQNAIKVNHHLKFVELSAWKNTGMEHWYDWLSQQLQAKN